MLSTLAKHFKLVKILMDCYTEKAAKVSKYKNPINDVGVMIVYGYDMHIKVRIRAYLYDLRLYFFHYNKIIASCWF